MLGWHIIVFIQTDGGMSPATVESAIGQRIAAWTVGSSGLNRLDTLVKTRKAIELGGNGYPLRFTGTAANLLPSIAPGPPDALTETIWLCAAPNAVAEKSREITVCDLTESVECGVAEWLLIEAWDQS
jgi:hypothetical protein